MLSEMSQTEKEKYCMISLCEILETNEQTKQKQTHKHREHFDGCQKGMGLGVWVRRGSV